MSNVYVEEPSSVKNDVWCIIYFETINAIIEKEMKVAKDDILGLENWREPLNVSEMKEILNKIRRTIFEEAFAILVL